MKSIALAIIIASLHMIPADDFNATSNTNQIFTALLYFFCIIAFCISLITP
jgi:hypothetical protein